ncbi:hypothetical protein SRS16CHR_04934 [Variovorax sp. SRS16]|uniref:hypothetical protein n=1 Tax=Variovorax sp. SRS16 TaxID=282217 RepID=UPI00131751BB|nr:hypothetical protein [Variovorax sp. SRS16]VTU31712.1 hypothetical protein SRS16CHR_04934 [Variovorax sp. SRS16]
MLDFLPAFCLEQPRRLLTLGRALACAGWLILFAGAIGHAATSATAAIHSIAKQAGVASTLADIYPSQPTWWVPESIVGCLPAVMLLALGLWLVSLGKQLQRLLRG